MYRLLTIAFLSLTICLNGQQTIGLTLQTEESDNGYTLFAPLTSDDTYLIDNCGELINKWEATSTPGLSAYLLPDGRLMRTGTANQNYFHGGGVGGLIEIYDWDSNLLWSYTIADSLQCQHHDIEMLPNGNILAVVWDYHSLEEVEAAGRVDAQGPVWTEKIVEIEPDYTNGGGTVVWEWRAWDHLVQESDPTKDNYGVVAESPGLMDINFIANNPSNADWLHINSVDYNAALDQIVLSVHHISEIWIVDHSTTTEEAASHTGGLSGKGGDILYRWGNPQVYQQGGAFDQELFKQHDAYWIQDSLEHAGMIMCYDNQAFTLQNVNGSAIDVINPPMDADGNYIYEDQAYGPAVPQWTYNEEIPTNFYSQRISGAQRLSNGNTLICEGASGRLFEVTLNGEKVWEYINPVNTNGPMDQGSIPMGNRVFRVYRYATDYSAFDGKDLTPQGYIENGSDFSCDLFSSSDIVDFYQQKVDIYPIPFNDQLHLDFGEYDGWAEIQILDSSSKLVFSKRLEDVSNTIVINPNITVPGIYFTKILTKDYRQSYKLVK